MNALMLVVYGLPAGDLFNNADLANMRQLMSIGAFGLVEQKLGIRSHAEMKRLEVDTWKAIAGSGRPCLWITTQNDVGPEPSAGEIVKTKWENGAEQDLSGQQLERARAWIKDRDWGACLIEDHGLQFSNGKGSQSNYLENLDQSLGKLFESLSDETVVAILIRTEVVLTGFILAAPVAEPVGEVRDAATQDVAATLMHLCELVSGETINSRLILRRQDISEGGDTVLSVDEEALLRERLSGLGYL